MKIALIHPPFRFKRSSVNPDFNDLNLGISSIGAMAKYLGHEIKTIDFQHDANATLDDAEDCDVVGLTTLLSSYGFLRESLPSLKRAGKTVIVGGSLISSYGVRDNLLMRVCPEIDVGVIGEGELAVKSVLENIASFKGLNVAVRGEVATDLDDLPEVDYRDWPAFEKSVKGNMANIMTSRGCYNACSFCFKNIPGVRSFSLSRIEREIEKIAGLKPRAIYFQDDVFTLDKNRAIEVAKMMQKHQLPYEVLSRVTDVNPDFLETLKETGCGIISYGVESFDESVLKRAGKNISREEIYNAIYWAKDAGITVKAFLIVGLPSENRKSLEATIRGVEETGIFPRARIAIPLPGTRIYQDAVASGRLDEYQLLKDFSEPDKYDTAEGDWIPLNMSDGLSDEELIEARNRLNSYGHGVGRII